MATADCPSCAGPVPSGARFCPSCGAGLDARVQEERRVVTVLFGDLVGSTALAEDRDPEQVKRLIEGCFQRLVADIEAFGGRVDKLLGDAVVALFGAPVAHEDDAERAVRAALRMLETLAEFSSEREPLRMRIGINTGEVLVGTLAGTEYTAMGDVVNTAARLQALAPPGKVLVGAATAGLLSEGVVRRPFGETIIRGRQRAEQPWLIEAAAPAGARPVRADVPFVGRSAELALLRTSLDLVRVGRGGLVTVVAEAGAGKTRLVERFLTEVDGDPILLSLIGAPYGERNAWAPLAGALARVLELPDQPDRADVADALTRRAWPLWGLADGDAELDRYRSAVTYTLGLPSALDRLDPAAAAAHLAQIVTDMIRRHAETRVTIVWFDNVQWASAPLRELLAVVARSVLDLPLLVIAARRPDDTEQWPSGPVDRPLLVRLPLAPLRDEEARELVEAVLPVSAGRTAVAEALVDRGAGNPLFLLELAAVAAGGGSDAALSGSLRALIAARLDELPAGQRLVVDNAAVLGSGDGVRFLTAFAEGLGQAFDPADLDALVADGILAVADGRWRFRSDVVREVAYATLTKQTRAARHAGVAAALRANGTRYLGQLAHHSACAAELTAELGTVPGVPNTIRDEAVADLTATAELALAEGRPLATRELVTRALALRPPDPVVERDLLLLRSTADLELRRFPDAQRDALVALDLAAAAADDVAEAAAHRRLGTAAYHLGDLPEARRHLDIAVAVTRRADDRSELAAALRARGFAEVFGGSLSDARRHLDEAMSAYQQLEDERGVAWTNHNLAWVAFQAGDGERAERLLVAAHELFAGLGDAVGTHWADGLLAYVLYNQGRRAEAERLATTVSSEAERWGDEWARLMMQTLMANLRLWAGELDKAEALAGRALAGFREAGDRYGTMMALLPLGRIQAAIGRSADAARSADALVSLGRGYGELGLAVHGAAGIAVHVGQASRGLELADAARARELVTGTDLTEVSVLRGLALAQLGRLGEARVVIEELDAEASTFVRAARALILARCGAAAAAEADAALVVAADASTYFDRSLALFARALLDPAGIGALAELAADTGDVVFAGVADVMLRPGRANAGNGWHVLASTAATEAGRTVGA